MIRSAIAAALHLSALTLAACSDDRPPEPTAEQSRQLNEAEDILDREAAAENDS